MSRHGKADIYGSSKGSKVKVSRGQSSHTIFQGDRKLEEENICKALALVV